MSPDDRLNQRPPRVNQMRFYELFRLGDGAGKFRLAPKLLGCLRTIGLPIGPFRSSSAQRPARVPGEILRPKGARCSHLQLERGTRRPRPTRKGQSTRLFTPRQARAREAAAVVFSMAIQCQQKERRPCAKTTQAARN